MSSQADSVSVEAIPVLILLVYVYARLAVVWVAGVVDLLRSHGPAREVSAAVQTRTIDNHTPVIASPRGRNSGSYRETIDQQIGFLDKSCSPPQDNNVAAFGDRGVARRQRVRRLAE